MEMGKLTAKLRDAVLVCLLAEGEEIKRYKNIEIPDELKKLEYQDFKFDVPLERRNHLQDYVRAGRTAREIPAGKGAENPEALTPRSAAAGSGACGGYGGRGDLSESDAEQSGESEGGIAIVCLHSLERCLHLILCISHRLE